MINKVNSGEFTQPEPVSDELFKKIVNELLTFKPIKRRVKKLFINNQT